MPRDTVLRLDSLHLIGQRRMKAQMSDLRDTHIACAVMMTIVFKYKHIHTLNWHTVFNSCSKYQRTLEIENAWGTGWKDGMPRKSGDLSIEPLQHMREEHRMQSITNSWSQHVSLNPSNWKIQPMCSLSICPKRLSRFKPPSCVFTSGLTVQSRRERGSVWAVYLATPVGLFSDVNISCHVPLPLWKVTRCKLPLRCLRKKAPPPHRRGFAGVTVPPSGHAA